MDLTESGSLKALILAHPYLALLELTEGIVDNGSTLRLGHVELDKHHPGVRAFAAGFSTDLSEAAQFRIAFCEVRDFAGHVVIYRQQARAEQAEEYLAGWVKPEHLPDAQRWVKAMNRHIAKMLRHKSGEQSSTPL